MQIILRGPAAGYEAEHTARIFFPGAEKAEDLPETEDFVLAESHEMTDLILVRKDGRLYWRTDLRSPEADPEYALCKLGIRPAERPYRHRPALGHDDRRAPGAHHPRPARGGGERGGYR